MRGWDDTETSSRALRGPARWPAPPRPRTSRRRSSSTWAASSTSPSTRPPTTAPSAFKEETGIEYLEFEVTNESQRDQALRRMARRGADVVVAVGFSFATPLEADRQGVPGHQVRDHRFGGRAAERAVGGVQGARGLVPGRHGGGAGLEDRQGRLRRRHGHPADPQLRPRLRAGRQARQRRRRGVRQHDRHDAGRLERSGQGRRARPEPVRPRRRRGLRRGRRHRPRRAPGRGRLRQARRSASTATRTTCIPAAC